MPFTYTPTIPAAPNLPSQDQPLMLANNQYLRDFGNKDHNFSLFSGSANDGYHTKTTFNVDIASPGPGFSSGVSVMYPSTANGQSQLFFKNGASGVGAGVQLTTHIANVPSVQAGPPAKGVTFLPGGQLMQWGYSTTNATTFIVAFNAAPTIPIVVTCTPTSAANQSFGGVVSIAAGNTGFTFQNNAGGAVSYYWMAIGQAP